MKRSEQDRKVHRMILRAELAVRKSREQIQRTDEILKQSQAACSPIRIKRPDIPLDQKFQ